MRRQANQLAVFRQHRRKEKMCKNSISMYCTHKLMKCNIANATRIMILLYVLASSVVFFINLIQFHFLSNLHEIALDSRHTVYERFAWRKTDAFSSQCHFLFMNKTVILFRKQRKKLHGWRRPVIFFGLNIETKQIYMEITADMLYSFKCMQSKWICSIHGISDGYCLLGSKLFGERLASGQNTTFQKSYIRSSISISNKCNSVAFCLL